MCDRRDVDAVLKQLQDCEDTEKMRRLLEEATPCNQCPEELRTYDEQNPDCCCRRRFQAELQKMARALGFNTDSKEMVTGGPGET